MEALKKLLIVIVYIFAAFGVVATINHNTANAAYEIVLLDLEHKTSKEKQQVIHVRGDFDNGLTRDVTKALEDNPNIDRIAFDSPGGNAGEAFQLANLLSEKMIRVWVPKARICLSACAVAFTGGYDYQIDGTLGFHNAWINYEEDVELTPKDGIKAYIEGQQLGTYATGFFFSNGFAMNLQIDIATHTDPEKFLVFNSEEDFLKYYVRNDDNPEGDLASNYWIESIDTKVWSDELTDYRKTQADELEASGGTYNVLKVTPVFSNNPAQ